MWFNPKYGRVGLFSMPYFIFFEALSPLIEVTGYVVFVWYLWHHSINSTFAILFINVALLLGVLNSVVSVVLQEISGHRYQGFKAWSLLLVAAVAENFGYRQMTVWWRLRGTIDWLLGKEDWGHMERKGIGPTLPPKPVA
jgi:hypothetical protein